MGQVSINENVMDLTPDGPRLKGMRCNNCGNHVFPMQSGCPKCTSDDVEEVHLALRVRFGHGQFRVFRQRPPLT